MAAYPHWLGVRCSQFWQYTVQHKGTPGFGRSSIHRIFNYGYWRYRCRLIGWLVYIQGETEPAQSRGHSFSDHCYCDYLLPADIQFLSDICPMLFDDTYLTIEAKSEGLFRDRGSKFLGYAYPVVSDQDIKSIVTDLKKEHPKAN